MSTIRNSDEVYTQRDLCSLWYVHKRNVRCLFLSPSFLSNISLSQLASRIAVGKVPAARGKLPSTGSVSDSPIFHSPHRSHSAYRVALYLSSVDVTQETTLGVPLKMIKRPPNLLISRRGRSSKFVSFLKSSKFNLASASFRITFQESLRFQPLNLSCLLLYAKLIRLLPPAPTPRITPSKLKWGAYS